MQSERCGTHTLITHKPLRAIYMHLTFIAFVFNISLTYNRMILLISGTRTRARTQRFTLSHQHKR